MNSAYSFSQTNTVQKVNSFVRSTYNWMGIGLALTGFTSYWASTSPGFLQFMYGNPLMPIVLFIGVIILCGFLSARVHKMQASTATGLYGLLTVVYGLMLAPIFLIYTKSSIVSTFFVCSATFISVSLFGMFTKRDLTGMGQFLMMGIWGLFIAIIVNLFVQSSGLEMIISCIGVLIFTGLTAYDTQKLKQMAVNIPGDATGAMIRKGAIMGALQLYLDFMGLFIYLLHFLGVARD